MSMTEEQQKGLAQLLDRLGSNLSGLKKAVESATNGMLAVKDAVEKSGKTNADAFDKVLAQNSTVLTEIKLLAKDIAEARADVKNVDDSIDDVRRDLTPVRGVPHQPRRDQDDDSVELGPAKVPARFFERIGRNLPWIVAGAIVALALLVFAVYASGARLVVEEKRSQPRHDEQQQQHHEQGDHQ